MTDLFQQSSLRLDAAIDTVAAAIASNTLSKKQLFATMTSLYGGGAAEGLWSQRDGFDLLEAGLARHL